MTVVREDEIGAAYKNKVWTLRVWQGEKRFIEQRHGQPLHHQPFRSTQHLFSKDNMFQKKKKKMEKYIDSMRFGLV